MNLISVLSINDPITFLIPDLKVTHKYDKTIPPFELSTIPIIEFTILHKPTYTTHKKSNGPDADWFVAGDPGRRGEFPVSRDSQYPGVPHPRIAACRRARQGGSLSRILQDGDPLYPDYF